LGKPKGVIHERVQAVGPERFGIVAVDCAKARSKWMLCNFYGTVLIPPTVVEHHRAALELATCQLKEAIARHGLRDHLVAIEMTGTYHRPVQRAFRAAGSETRLVHPYASRHYRLPAHGDTKTDDHDLEGIFRAAVNGFGLVEPVWPETYQCLQLVARHRRDLVEKRARLQCQIREYLDRCLPGYAALFPKDDLWTRPAAMLIARHAQTPEGIRRAGAAGMRRWLAAANVTAYTTTVARILGWAGGAAPPDPLAPHLTGVWHALHDDWQAKTAQIQQLERKAAALLVQTPYILLLSHPGINVVSASELAGETGPMEHYAHAKAISGRAGLFPSRYQSDQVDHAGGLARFRNVRMRAAWLRVAANLVTCNDHFRGKAAFWAQRGAEPRDVRCRVANRLTRSVFQMVGGRRLYHHPSHLDRNYVLDKLLVFHQEHGTPPHETLRDLKQAAAQIPREEHAAEAVPLAARREKARRQRRRAGPQPIATVLVEVLARLGVDELQSEAEASSPTVGLVTRAPDNAVVPMGSVLLSN
jgi:transposase